MPSGFEIVLSRAGVVCFDGHPNSADGLTVHRLDHPLTVAQYAADPKESTSASDDAMKNRSWRMEFADAGTGSNYSLPLYGLR